MLLKIRVDSVIFFLLLYAFGKNLGAHCDLLEKDGFVNVPVSSAY